MLRRNKPAIELAERARERIWRYPSFAGALFRGEVPWEEWLTPFPEQSAEDKAQGDALIAQVRELIEEYIDPNEVDRLGELPEDALLALAEIGCFGMTIPEAYGGLGLSQTNFSRVITFVASYCNSTAVWLAAHQSVGAVQPLLLFGTDEQKQEYLPRLARGALSAFALSESATGSDPSGIQTVADPSLGGTSYILNGEKLWCANSPRADMVVVVARTPSMVVRGRERAQLTAFLVETDSPGFEIGSIASLMGVRGTACGMIRLDNLEVPADNIIGEPGDGLRVAFSALNVGRLTMPAAASANARAALHFAGDWCRERRQWGLPIGKHLAVADLTARMAADVYAMQCVNQFTCALADRGNADIRIESALAKLFSTEAAWRICDDLMQIRGGRGYETAESLANRGEDPVPAERLFRDARIGRIIEGTSEIMRLYIAREAIDFHVSRILHIVRARRGRFRRGLKLSGFYAAWYAKRLLPGRIDGLRRLSKANRAHARFVTRMSQRLGRRLFRAMLRHRENLEREHLVIGDLVDIGTHLFAMAVTLAHAEHVAARNCDTAAEAEALCDLFCAHSAQTIRDRWSRRKFDRSPLVRKVADAVLEGRTEWLLDDIHREFPPQFESTKAVRRDQAARRAQQEAAQQTAEQAETSPEPEAAHEKEEAPENPEASRKG